MKRIVLALALTVGLALIPNAKSHSVVAGLQQVVTPVVLAQGGADDCAVVASSILSWGGYWEITDRQYFDSVMYVQFEAYFPSIGDWWFGISDRRQQSFEPWLRSLYSAPVVATYH